MSRLASSAGEGPWRISSPSSARSLIVGYATAIPASLLAIGVLVP